MLDSLQRGFRFGRPCVTLGAATEDDDKASARVRSASATRVKGFRIDCLDYLLGQSMVREVESKEGYDYSGH